jgi:lipopolysaccharide/colanic/teichoic acid biosynthesis glycosyltransferase
MVSIDPEKTKARRAIWILYAVMGLFILLPLVLFWIFR